VSYSSPQELRYHHRHSVFNSTVLRLEALYAIPITYFIMQYPSLLNTLLLVHALRGGVNAAPSDDRKSKPVDPCTIVSSIGSFFDLRPLSIQPPVEGKKPSKSDKVDSWHAKGYDYGSNFTLNICAPVVEEIKNVKGVARNRWQNVSAYYESGSKIYSLG